MIETRFYFILNYTENPFISYVSETGNMISSSGLSDDKVFRLMWKRRGEINRYTRINRNKNYFFKFK